jgi:hypothetical protein
MKLNYFKRIFLALILLASGKAVAQLETIYDAPPGASAFLSSPREYGDEVVFGGTGRELATVSFDFYANYQFNDATIRFTIYAQDGPLVGPDASPGTPLARTTFDVNNTAPGLATALIDYRGMGIILPDRVTLAVQFLNLGGSNDGGAVLPDSSPTIGQSGNDYWQRDVGTGWQLYQVPSGLANFRFTVTAVPESSTAAVFAGLGMLGLIGWRMRLARLVSVKKAASVLAVAAVLVGLTSPRAQAQSTIFSVPTGEVGYYSTGLEYGDEAVLAGTDRNLVSVDFDYYSSYARTGALTLNIYAQDGPLAGPDATPGTLLASTTFDINVGLNTAMLDYSTEGVVLPDRVTIAVQFAGASANNPAGLIVPNATPGVGSSGNDFWQRDPSGWTLYNFGPTLANFRISVTAVPEPSTNAAIVAGIAIVGLCVWKRRQARNNA